MEDFRPVHIKHYRLEKILGQGGMGTVYKAKDLEKDKVVAIKKTLIPKNLGARVKEITERFKREYLFLYDIDHLNVIKAYDFFEEKRQLFMVLEFIPGITLENFIIRHAKSITPMEQLAIATQIARAIEVINIAGIIHRDVKPANIILEQKTKQVKLLDLGIAKSLVEELNKLTQVGTTVGTPEYMSPEQTDGHITINTDVFSLGIVLYQFFLWQKHSPFRMKTSIATMTAIATKELPPLISQLDASLSKMDRLLYQQLSTIIDKALVKKPMQRWSSSREIADQLYELHQVYSKLAKKQTEAVWVPTKRTASGEVEKLEKLGKKYGQDVIVKKNRKVVKRRKANKKSSGQPIVAILIAITIAFIVFLGLSQEPEADLLQKEQKPLSKNKQNSSTAKSSISVSQLKSQSKTPIKKVAKETKKTKEYQALQKNFKALTLYQRWEALAQFIRKYPKAEDAKKAQERVVLALRKTYQNTYIKLQKISKSKNFSQLSKYQAFFANVSKNSSITDKISQKSALFDRSLNTLFDLYDTLKAQLQQKRQQKQQKLQSKWQKFAPKTSALIANRSWDSLQLRLKEFAPLKDKKISSMLIDINGIIRTYKNLYEIIKKKKGKKISISLIQGKFVRGQIVKVVLHKFALKGYRRKLFTIRFSNLQVREIIKFYPALKKKAYGHCYLGILYLSQKKLSLAQKHLQIAHQKGHVSALEWLSYVKKAQAKELAKIQKIEIISPQKLLEKSILTVKLSELLFAGKVTGGPAVKKILCNGVAIHFGKENRQFKKKFHLKDGKNKLELLIESVDGKKTRKKWSIVLPKKRNLPIHRGSLARLGVYFTQPVKKFKRLKWKFRAGRSIHTSGVIYRNSIYFSNDGGNFFCLSLAGKLLWKYQGHGAVQACSTVIAKGIAYFGTDIGHFYAIDAHNGKQIWHRKFETIMAPPLVTNDMLYLGVFDKFFYALNAKTGETIWRFETRAVIRGGAALVGETIYFGALDRHVYALNAKTGQKKWDSFVKREVYATPAVSDQKVYAPAANGYLYALDVSSGQILWGFPTEEAISSSPAVANGCVYFGSIDSYLYALDAKTGKEKWRFKANDAIRTDVIVAEKVVYFTSDDAHLYAIDSKTGKLLWKYKTELEITRSSPVVLDGVVYFGSDDGFFYAIE